MRHTVFVLILLGLSCIGFVQSASAQCVVDNKKVFIDPQLVPRRPYMTRDALERVMRRGDLSSSQKQQMRDKYMQQLQPIEMPIAGA